MPLVTAILRALVEWRSSTSSSSSLEYADYSDLTNEEEQDEEDEETPRNSSQYHVNKHFRNKSSLQSSQEFLQEIPSSPSHQDEDNMSSPLPFNKKRGGVDLEKMVPRKFISMSAKIASKTISKIDTIAQIAILRPLMCIGFFQLCTGMITATGMMKGNTVFNGLAHFIKGAIFLWYGVITLGRWMGAFADFGWAWNIKPTASTVPEWKKKVPTGEAVESGVIFVYGATQVWMEHLGSDDGVWSHKDLQHVSIAIMMFWAGLIGMLVESKSILRYLNIHTEQVASQARREVPSEQESKYIPPRLYNFSFNPFPSLVIFMVGIMMSMHVQENMLATMIHKQWGYLLAGFAFWRISTYIILSLSPPTSVYPSRPVTELLSSFCLICGGLIFMASNAETVGYLLRTETSPMFVFNLSVSLAVAVMTWIMLMMALKGWAWARH